MTEMKIKPRSLRTGFCHTSGDKRIDDRKSGCKLIAEK